MTLYHFTGSYDGKIEADDPDMARTWALEEVEAGNYRPTMVEVEPVKRKDAENGD